MKKSDGLAAANELFLVPLSYLHVTSNPRHFNLRLSLKLSLNVSSLVQVSRFSTSRFATFVDDCHQHNATHGVALTTSVSPTTEYRVVVGAFSPTLKTFIR